jgi:predicted Fe-Mo cluster-binding NifX family protein
MKIAIASSGKDEDSEVSSVSGRAPYFLIFEDKKLVKTIKNPFAVGGGGAGFAVAKMLKDEKVDLVVAGQFGGNMIGALEEKNIKKKELYEMTVKEALEKCQDHSD